VDKLVSLKGLLWGTKSVIFGSQTHVSLGATVNLEPENEHWYFADEMLGISTSDVLLES
jgi:hypothetical protein